MFTRVHFKRIKNKIDISVINLGGNINHSNKKKLTTLILLVVKIL